MATVNRLTGERQTEQHARVEKALGFTKHNLQKTGSTDSAIVDEGLDLPTASNDTIFVKPQLLKRPSSRNSNPSTYLTTSSSPKNVAVSPCDSGVGSVESSPNADPGKSNSPFAQPAAPAPPGQAADSGVIPEPKKIPFTQKSRKKSLSDSVSRALQDPRLLARSKRGYRPGATRGLVLLCEQQPPVPCNKVQKASPFREPELPPYRPSQYVSSPAAAHCSPLHSTSSNLFANLQTCPDASLSSTALRAMAPLSTTSSSDRSLGSLSTTSSSATITSPASNADTVQYGREHVVLLFKVPNLARSPQIRHRFKRHRQLKSMKRGFSSDPMFASEYFDHLSAGVKSKQLKLISDENQRLLVGKLTTVTKVEAGSAAVGAPASSGQDDTRKGRDAAFRVPQRIPNKKVAAMDCE